MPGLSPRQRLFPKRVRYPASVLYPHFHHQRGLLTLAIETSCDDTSVAILERTKQHSKLHFHSTITANNLVFKGIHPIVALKSHQQNLAGLVSTALLSLPAQDSDVAHLGNSLLVDGVGGVPRKKPNFVAVTRGPGMKSSLNVGLDTAKGLAVAWGVPLLGVNHMQAHALTPRLVSSLEASTDAGADTNTLPDPKFPFISLLVSGGNTMVVHSRSLTDHEILVDTMDMAIGIAIDKCAREILPEEALAGSKTVMYGRLLEDFAFPQGSHDYAYVPPETSKEGWKPRSTAYSWMLSPPLSTTLEYRSLMQYSFAGTTSSAKRLTTLNPSMSLTERRTLAQQTLLVVFEHLTTRLISALELPGLQTVNTIVVSGGVASNLYLRHVLRAMLDKRGFGQVRLLFPPIGLCTDNAAMVAWAGMEMWDAGYRSELDITAVQKWPIDSLGS